MNVFKRLFSRKHELKVEGIKDELIGFWENDIDDNSGVHTMIWGYGLEFFENGEGIDCHWGASARLNPDRSKLNFLWKRNSLDTIFIKLEEDEEWEKIEYEISDYTGRDNKVYFKIIEKGKEDFGFTTEEPMYKLK